MLRWDPERYLQFADERGRPFADLLGRVGATAPRRVVDLGCGPGQLTATLAARWRDAEVEGLDSSPEMVERAQAHAGPRLRFAVADIVGWRPAAPVDVVVSNAALQWVPGHRAVLPGLVDALAPGGWLAFQVPGNFEAPSHRVLRSVAAEPPFAAHTAALTRPGVAEPADYLADLVGLGCAVEAWETTYLHVLRGKDPVLGWVRSTVLRPVLARLGEDDAAELTAQYAAALRAAYPRRPDGTTLLPFRRVFAVGHAA